MSLDKSIQHGKEKRKPFRGGKAVCGSCRNHGGCSWCQGNRTIQFHKEDLRTKDQVDDWFGYWGQACEMEAWSNHLEKKYEAVGLDTWGSINFQLGTFTATYD